MFQYLHAEKQSKNHQKCRGKRVSGRGSATALETRLLSKIKTITQMHPRVKRWKDLCLVEGRDEIQGIWETGNPEISHLFYPTLT